MAAIASTRMPFSLSSLELMLQEIQREEEEEHGDVPPALPARPVTRARLPRSRARLPFSSKEINGCEDNEEQVGSILESKKSENGVAEKPGKISDEKEASVQDILGIQNHIDQLDKGVIALQSFIRGANARKYFSKKITAIEVIQKHLKSQLKRSRLLEEEDQAVIYLQESIRGWLAWRHLNSMDQREKQLSNDAKNMKSFEMKDQQVQVPYSVLVDLQRRVLKTEALLDEKKEENATLRLQMKQLERQRQQYETRMQSMERTWQDQLTSLQASLAVDKKGSSPRNSAGKLGMLFSLPENCDEDRQDSPLTNYTSRLSSDRIELDDHLRNTMSGENVAEEVHIDPEVEVELRKLKLKFRTWKRDFKMRLVFAKTKAKKLGNSEGGERISCHKKWWGRK